MKFLVLKVRFTEFAFAELEDAKEYYDLEQPGLGKRFKQDVKEAVNRVANSPTLYPVARDGVRKCILHRFPYTVFYALGENEILILAVASHYREPFYWVESK
ncbi:MAG: type II toxin-antitoxin system RelE/ParE family toxin [Campylobacteraceae bacterium]|jgi:plasmid stabilization system protein ParE|nr:type II toxin-antitoxin system RelE/ParE family toxin [Campylobacteraceae bacterium]